LIRPSLDEKKRELGSRFGARKQKLSVVACNHIHEIDNTLGRSPIDIQPFFSAQDERLGASATIAKNNCSLGHNICTTV
jgi:hypothetical protein